MRDSPRRVTQPLLILRGTGNKWLGRYAQPLDISQRWDVDSVSGRTCRFGGDVETATQTSSDWTVPAWCVAQAFRSASVLVCSILSFSTMRPEACRWFISFLIGFNTNLEPTQEHIWGFPHMGNNGWWFHGKSPSKNGWLEVPQWLNGNHYILTIINPWWNNF